MNIEINGISELVTPLSEARAATVAGRCLPDSYCRFISSFGYGRFGRLLIIYSASADHPDSIFDQGLRVRGFIEEAVAEGYFEFEPDGRESQGPDLYPFAASENGEYFVWDMGDFKGGEYPIYCIGARMGGMRYAAADLYQLFERLSGDAIREVMGPGYSPLPSVFEGM